MSILISGGTGFVGLNLAELLLARGETVVIYAGDRPPAPALRTLADLPGRLILEQGDVRDGAAFTECLRRHQVDRLFPFAAVTAGPAREAAEPELVLDVNIMGFLAQLRAARDAGVRRVIAPSSSAVYGDSFYGPAPMDEHATPCRPLGLYGITKYAVERMALRMGEQWGLDVIAARIGALFGPWERDTGLRDSLSPYWQLARAATAGQEAVLPADLPAYSWIYARDAAAGLVHLLDMQDPPHRVFNLCSGVAWGPRMLSWCALLAGACPGFTWRQSADPAEVTIRLSETRPRQTMDIGRITATGWQPRYLPDAAYADYLAWTRAHANALR